MYLTDHVRCIAIRTDGIPAAYLIQNDFVNRSSDVTKPPLCLANAAEEPGLHACCCLLPGDWNWSEFRHVQLGGYSPAAAVAGIQAQPDRHCPLKLAI